MFETNDDRTNADRTNVSAPTSSFELKSRI
jgi:hypothetical protein